MNGFEMLRALAFVASHDSRMMLASSSTSPVSNACFIYWTSALSWCCASIALAFCLDMCRACSRTIASE
jgi:hypothetical protein